MSSGKRDTVSLFASPQEFASSVGLKSSIYVIKNLIRNAKESIFITCYELSSREITEVIIEAAKRHVLVDIYIDESGRSSGRIERSSQNLEDLRACGVKILQRVNTDFDNHTKAIIVDRKHGIIGSANFTHSGMHRNIEIGAKISGPTCAIFVDKFISGMRELIGDE